MISLHLAWRTQPEPEGETGDGHLRALKETWAAMSQQQALQRDQPGHSGFGIHQIIRDPMFRGTEVQWDTKLKVRKHEEWGETSLRSMTQNHREILQHGERWIWVFILWILTAKRTPDCDNIARRWETRKGEKQQKIWGAWDDEDLVHFACLQEVASGKRELIEPNFSSL